MKNVVNKIFLALLLLGFLAGANFAFAAPMQQPPEPENHKFTLMPAAAEIGQQIEALVTGGENLDAEPQETFGTRALGLMLTFFNVLGNEGLGFVGNFEAFPQLCEWYNQQLENPALSERWMLIGHRLLIVVGLAILAGWAVDLVLLPIRRNIKRRQPRSVSAKFWTLFSWLLLGLMPIIAFLGMALFLMGQGDPHKVVRFVVMTVVYALALLRLIGLVVRFLLAPRTQSLRLLPVDSPQAVTIQRWIGWYSRVMVFGYFSLDVAQFTKIPTAVISAFSSLVGLVVVIMTIIIITRKRSYVSTLLRGDLSAARHDLSLWESLRLWSARSWHVLAISYLVIGYIVTMLSAGGGFAIMQRGTILTLLVLVAMRLGFFLTTRMCCRRDVVGDTAGIYRPVFRVMLRLAIWALAVIGIAAAWGMDVKGLLATAWGQRVMGSLFSITSTIVIVVGIYELLHAAIKKKLDPRDAKGKALEPNARARTLLPMVRNAAIMVLSIIVGLVTLSELGINIAPMLAGAGVIGVAIGFGSQTLVKDFLTGLFIILEDNIAVGDIVSIGEHSGEVESISIRTLRLRDAKGNVHILPFSEITKIINMSKGYSYALMDIGVAYSSDLKHVMEVMTNVGDELQADSGIGKYITNKIDIQGVDNFADSSITIRCRIKTKPGMQWDVKRAYLFRLKERFDKEKIEIPFPTVMHLQHVETEG